MEESLEVRRKRLMFRAHHMGMNENDIIFGRFAEAFLGDFDAGQLDRFEALIAQADNDLWDWVTGRTPPPAAFDTDVLRMLKSFKLPSAR